MVETSNKAGEYTLHKIISPKVSVIIPSHRNEYIDEIALLFTKEVCGDIPIELIIVADYDINHYKEKYTHIEWVYIPDKSISIKRNKGIVLAKGDICAFIDDDCIPESGWILHAINYLNSHPEMAGVEGMTRIIECKEKQGSYREFKRLEKQGFRTNNIFYRKKVLLDVNMFDERFTVQREDVDLAYSIIEAGHSIGYSSEIKVKHRYRKNEKWDLLKNCVNRRYDPLLFLKHKKLYSRFIGNPYPPGILILIIMYFLTVLSYNFNGKYFYIGIAIDLIVILLLTIRRTGIPFLNFNIQWIREYVSFMVSPFVLTGALLYGSIRFKSLSFIYLMLVWNPFFKVISMKNKN